MQTSQRYPIIQECNLLAVSECFHLATFSETLMIERAILSELTCTRFFWENILWGAATSREFSVKSSYTILLRKRFDGTARQYGRAAYLLHR